MEKVISQQKLTFVNKVYVLQISKFPKEEIGDRMEQQYVGYRYKVSNETRNVIVVGSFLMT